MFRRFLSTPTGIGLWLVSTGIASTVMVKGFDPSNPAYGSIVETLVGVAIILYDWWRRHGRKLAEKAWGWVVDLGHRLAVSPEPGRA